MTIPDYSIISVGEINILCIGGAISNDRKTRKFFDQKKLEDLIENEKISEEEANKKINRSYWVDEIPFYDEKILNEINEKNILITHVITHTSPDFCFIPIIEQFWRIFSIPHSIQILFCLSIVPICFSDNCLIMVSASLKNGVISATSSLCSRK